MKEEQIGMLHPGAMGAFVAANAVESGHKVYWVGAGRSAQTRERAERYGLIEVPSVEALAERCAVVLSVCPPHAAQEVAEAVLASGFKGVYVEANAIAPQRAREIGALLGEGGIEFVDGGIVGGPVWEAGSTWLYLAGPKAEDVADLFGAGPLRCKVLGEEIGQASGLKMSFAAYSKGSTALICGVVAASEAMGVREELLWLWGQDGDDLAEESVQRMRRVTAKAWRFAGEMEEIAATFGGAGLPDGFHLAASEVYARMAGFKDAEGMPELDEVLGALLERG